jgi:cleavage and polyadenylation specificity factor subunit 5
VYTWNSSNSLQYRPGDYLRPTDPEIDGFKSIMNARLAPPPSSSMASPGDNDWEIADTLAQWYRPHFETNMYPYLPPHVTRPKECKKLYLIQLPKSRTLSVPKNMKLLAVPLFELYDNSARYGPQLSALPHYLSRFRWEMVNEDGEVEVWTPGGQVGGEVKERVLAGEKGLENGNGTSTSEVKTEVKIMEEADVKMEDEQQAEDGP